MSQPENEFLRESAIEFTEQWFNRKFVTPEPHTYTDLMSTMVDRLVAHFAALASRAPAMSDTKGQPAESTASTFEEEALKMFDEARNEAALFGDFRNRLVAWFSSKLQKQAASEYERGRRDGLEKSAKDSGTAQAWGEHIGFKIGLATAAQHKYSHGRNGCQCSCGAYFNFNRAEIDWPAHIIALAVTSGTPAEHNSARAPHNKFASLWCDACPRPAASATTPTELELAEARLEGAMEVWRGPTLKQTEIVKRLQAEHAMLFSAQAAPPPADETLPAGDNGCICKGNWRLIVAETESLIGQEFIDSRNRRWRFFGVVYGDDDYYYGMAGVGAPGLALLSCVGSIEGHGYTPAAAQPRGAQAAAPTTTNVREAFEKWYAAYKDITLYIDGMQDAFEAGYNARSKERDAQAAPPGPKCSHGVLMREFCQGCEDVRAAAPGGKEPK